MTSAFSWQNSVSLCPASFCTPRPNFSVTPGISWLPTFAFQSPMMKGLEGLMLKLKLQYLGHRMQRTDSLEKTLMLGKSEGRRRRGWQRMRWLDASPTQWTWVWVNPRSWWWTGRPGVLQSMGSQSRTWLSGWTELNLIPQSHLMSRQMCSASPCFPVFIVFTFNYIYSEISIW